jgi:hypothetical protein
LNLRPLAPEATVATFYGFHLIQASVGVTLWVGFAFAQPGGPTIRLNRNPDVLALFQGFLGFHGDVPHKSRQSFRGELRAEHA